MSQSDSRLRRLIAMIDNCYPGSMSMLEDAITELIEHNMDHVSIRNIRDTIVDIRCNQQH